MTLKEIEKILEFKGDDQDIKNKIKAIVDKLYPIDKIDNSIEMGTLTSVDDFKEIGFGSLQYPDTQSISQKEKEIEKRKILAELDSIQKEVNSWWENNNDKFSYNKDSDKDKSSKTSKKFLQFVPWIVAFIVLAVGLGLGLTVFAEKQDALYFTLESVKDIVGGFVSWLLAKGIVDTKNKNDIGEHAEKSGIALLTVFELAALVFSVFLFLSAELAIIERFTQWNRFTYLWMGLSVASISVGCTVALCMRLCKSGKVERKE